MKASEIIKAIGDIIGTIIRNPRSLFLVLHDETKQTRHVVQTIGRKEFSTLDINYFFQNKAIDLDHYSFLEGGSLLTDLALLKSIAQSFETCEYLEIGSWRGESIVNVADVPNTNCTSINLSADEIIARGFPEKYAKEHGCFIQDRKNIEQIFADSQTFNFESLNKKFDLIFVDGDHKYNAVKTDTENVFKLLRNENSVIVWHDYAFDPVTPRYSVIAAILDGLPKEEHRHLYHVSNTMCAVYIRSEAVKQHLLLGDGTLNKVFNIKIENRPFSANQAI